MGFFNKKKAAIDQTPPQNITSRASTVVPSQNASNSNLDSEKRLDSALADKASDSSSTSSPKKTEANHPLAAETESQRNSTQQNEPEDEKKVVEEQVKESEQDQQQEDDVVYPSGLKLVFITIALCLCVFLVALDNTIIATAIPKITDRFNSLNDVGWYGSSYLLTTCALQLFFGR
jgi:hypothetical protein